MILTVTFEPDADLPADAGILGHLLHKHPDRVQRFSAPVGDVHVFYPESTSERCTAAMVLEVDPVALARSKRFRGTLECWRTTSTTGPTSPRACWPSPSAPCSGRR